MALVNGRDAADQETWREVEWALAPFSATVTKLREQYPNITAAELIELTEEHTLTALTEVALRDGAESAISTMCAALATALIDRERLRERVAELELRETRHA